MHISKPAPKSCFRVLRRNKRKRFQTTQSCKGLDFLRQTCRTLTFCYHFPLVSPCLYLLNRFCEMAGGICQVKSQSELVTKNFSSVKKRTCMAAGTARTKARGRNRRLLFLVLNQSRALERSGQKYWYGGLGMFSEIPKQQKSIGTEIMRLQTHPTVNTSRPLRRWAGEATLLSNSALREERRKK